MFSFKLSDSNLRRLEGFLLEGKAFYSLNNSQGCACKTNKYYT